MSPAAQKPLKSVVETEKMDEVRDWLDGKPSVIIAEELHRLTPAQMAVAFRVLPKDRALHHSAARVQAGCYNRRCNQKHC